MRVQAIEHGEIAPRRARLSLLLLHLIDQIGAFDFFSGKEHGIDRIALKRSALARRVLLASGHQLRALIREMSSCVGGNGPIFRDQRECAIQDGRGRTPVLFQSYQFCTRKLILKQCECRARSPTKAVECLVRVADSAYVALLRGELLQNLHLLEIGVLELVDQNAPRLLLFLSEQLRICLEQRIASRNHVAEGAEIFLIKHVLDGGEYAADFAASSKRLFIGERSGVLGFTNAWREQFARFDASQIFCILLGTHEFVMTPAHEVEQIVQKLAEVGGTDEIMQPKLADAAAQVNPQILIVQNAEIFPAADEKVVAV